MTTIGARRHGDGRGFWRVGWLAIVNDAEIQGVKFATKEAAISFAMRVAKYQGETICEGATQLKPKS
jgi:hypothetical protein